MINPQEKSERARKLFLEGYNCAQALVGAFDAETGISLQNAARIYSGFGGGIGGLRTTCGAVSGIAAVLGIISGYNEPENYEAKKKLYKNIQDCASKFILEYGTVSCLEILHSHGIDPSEVPSVRNAEYYASRPCMGCIGYAASILAEKLNEIAEKKTDQ